jgi:hypothetical protein
LTAEQGEGEGGAGGEGGGPHEMESSAYELGRILTEQFELPNLQDKGKRRSLTTYSYELTDRNRRTGQLPGQKGHLEAHCAHQHRPGQHSGCPDIEPSELCGGPG